jgi:hypothetical protein
MQMPQSTPCCDHVTRALERVVCPALGARTCILCHYTVRLLMQTTDGCLPLGEINIGQGFRAAGSKVHCLAGME